MTSPISPCPYPGCRDINGNPRLTRDIICEPSRRHYRTVLDRIALHYVLIRRDMPKPAATSGERVMRVVAREYGHPAEWASDQCRAIADQLSEAHDQLAEHLGHDGPPWQGHDETRRVAVSHHYLTAWFAELCTMPGATDTAIALHDLDRDIRRGLGQTHPRRHLGVPCPECGLLTLTRATDSTDAPVECGNCGHHIPVEQHHWWARVLLDEILDTPPPD